MTETPEQKRARHRTLIVAELERKSPGEVWPHARVWLGEEEATKLCGPKPTTRVAVRKRTELPPGHGVGTELTKLLTELKLHTECSRCRELAARMDREGIEWTKANRATIIASLQQGKAGTTRMQRIKAMGAAVLSGLAWRLNPLDPLNSLLDEAIRRAEASC